MTMPVISDPGLPGLRQTAEHGVLVNAIDNALCKATATAWRCQASWIARFRYRAGNRAILQLDLTLSGPDGEQQDVPGALWLYNGDKAKKAIMCLEVQDPAAFPAMIFVHSIGGLLTLFPHDRRVPDIARFLASSSLRALDLTGSQAPLLPELARYRPGLGATFRWQTASGVSFVKIFNDRPASERYADLETLCARIQSPALAAPTPLGFDNDVSAVALSEARGVPLAECLSGNGGKDQTAAIDVVLGGFDTLNRAKISPRRNIGGEDLLKRGRAVVNLLGAVDQGLCALAVQALDVLTASQPSLRAVPSHMDMKIEHVLIDGNAACLLDLDSLALSDPLYDPAMLAARLELAGLEGVLPDEISRKAIETLRSAVPVTRRSVFDWLFCIARFQTARFLVQNSRPNWRSHVSRLMDAIRARVCDAVLSG